MAVIIQMQYLLSMLCEIVRPDFRLVLVEVCQWNMTIGYMSLSLVNYAIFINSLLVVWAVLSTLLLTIFFYKHFPFIGGFSTDFITTFSNNHFSKSSGLLYIIFKNQY